MYQVRSVIPLILSGILLFSVSMREESVLAAKPQPTPPGHHLNITEVQVDLTEAFESLTILGKHFDFGPGPLVVTLAGTQLTIDQGLTDVTQGRIVTHLPALFTQPGDYLLVVSTGNGQSQNDEYDLTIGAVGPQGPEGEVGQDGAAGQDGADGKDGTNGTDGTSCTITGTVVSCTDDTSTDVQGPPGPAGGLTDAVCSDGEVVGRAVGLPDVEDRPVGGVAADVGRDVHVYIAEGGARRLVDAVGEEHGAPGHVADEIEIDVGDGDLHLGDLVGVHADQGDYGVPLVEVTVSVVG